MPIAMLQNMDHQFAYSQWLAKIIKLSFEEIKLKDF